MPSLSGRTYFGCLAIFLLSLGGYSRSPNAMEHSDFEEILDIPYCTCKGNCGSVFSKHELDLYLPNSLPSSKCPVVVFVHGGSWLRGDRRAFRHFFSFYDTNLLLALVLYYYGLYWNVGRSFAKSGIACAVISYRLSRLQFPWILIEVFSSMLMSLTVVIVPLTLLVLLSCGVLALVGWNVAENWYSQKQLQSTVFIFVSLCILWLFVCHAGQARSITRVRKFLPFIISVTLSGIYTMAFDMDRESFALCLTLCFAVCLFHSFLEFKNHPIIGHPDHLMDVAQSLRWVKTYGEKSNRYNAAELFVCGHSAGGHLVSLLVLKEEILKGVGLSAQDIRGVISISGVYNLESLAGTVMEHFILRPAFGRSVKTWQNASPVECISMQDNIMDNDAKNCKNVSFLVINAEKDFHLIKDAELFVQKLKDFNFKCHHVIMTGVNHFSIVAIFGRTTESQGGETIDKLCCEFIRKTLQGPQTVKSI